MPTWSWKKRLLIVLAVNLPLILLDRFSKIWAIENFKNQPYQKHLWDTFTFVYAENRGAWGSLGSEWPDEVRFFVFSLLPVVFLFGLIVFMVKKDFQFRSEFWALTLILAGGIGNVYDRIVYAYVVDFMHLGLKMKILGIPLATNIFNVADVIIVIGGLLLFYAYLKEKKLAAKNSK